MMSGTVIPLQTELFIGYIFAEWNQSNARIEEVVTLTLRLLITSN
jgi:hypothetical protein